VELARQQARFATWRYEEIIGELGEDLYAGPQSAYVPKTFSSSRRYTSLPDLGFIDALIKADKDFDLIVIPGGDHGMGSYGNRRMRDFFVRHLQYSQ